MVNEAPCANKPNICCVALPGFVKVNLPGSPSAASYTILGKTILFASPSTGRARCATILLWANDSVMRLGRLRPRRN